MNDPNAPRSNRRLAVFRYILLAVTTAASFGALTFPDALHPSVSPLNAGDISPRDYVAPTETSFESVVLTERRKQAAYDSVPPVFTPPDPAISRRQVGRLRAALDSLTLIRSNPDTNRDEKRNSIASIPELTLSTETIDLLLFLTDTRWEAARLEALTVLERIMRGVIRDSDVETVRRSVPSLISFSMSESDAGIVSELVKPFVAANSLHSPELTEAARTAERDAVAPIVVSYKAGETIIRAGGRLTEEQVEALQALGLIRSASQPLDLLGKGALTVMLAAFTTLYFYRRKRLGFLYEPRSMIVIAALYLVFLAGARLAIPDNVLIPYVYPLPAVGMLIAALFGMEAGIVISIVTCFIAAYGFDSNLLPYYLFASLCGALALGPARRFWYFIWAGASVAGAGILILLAFRFSADGLDWLGAAQLLLAAAGMGFLSAAFALLGQYFLAQWLGLATTLHLLDISRPDHPLLQFFLRNAPGTYQHSLQVANLAEQAAEAIGADPLLARVGAIFHDVGKSANPAFFIENQAPGHINPHQDMDPELAAAAIIRHVTDGAALARKYRLPRRMIDFMLEHHGTMLTRYQYNQALQKADGDAAQIDIEKFHYPGPRPRSRETAILMLADGSEARSRAQSPQTDDEMRAIVRGVIERVQQEGQLDHTTLTLRDLNTIVESFVSTFRGAYHPRIQYPAAEPPPASAPSVTIPKK